MSCYRQNCENIMCYTHVDGVGYICRECQNEFKEYLERFDKKPKTEGEIKSRLKEFMSTPKGKYEEGKEMAVEEFFHKYTE